MVVSAIVSAKPLPNSIAGGLETRTGLAGQNATACCVVAGVVVKLRSGRMDFSRTCRHRRREGRVDLALAIGDACGADGAWPGRRTGGAAVAYVELQNDSLPTNPGYRLHNAFGLFRIALAGNDNAHAAPGAFKSGAGPKATTAARHDDDLHASLLCVWCEKRLRLSTTAHSPNPPQSLPISAFSLHARMAPARVGRWNSNCKN